MTTAFTWKVSQLERHTVDGIVTTVHYTVDASDGTYSAGAYGSVGLDQPDLDLVDDDEIIPFADLTPEIVIDWVKTKLGGDEKVEEIEAALQSQLDEQHAPTRAAGLPWAG